mgnify:CR=1 FL=1
MPDVDNKINYSGKLGHLKTHNFNLKYLGVLSRFQHKKIETKYDLLVLLSGPEPQRTLLEEKLIKELKNHKGIILFVRGVLGGKTKISVPKNFSVVDYLLSNELEKAINQSKIVISRSGYSTIMDLAVLGKKAFFIPTPGQFEQEYLSKKLSKKLITPFTFQQNFNVTKLRDLDKFSGFKIQKNEINLELFNLFQGK